MATERQPINNLGSTTPNENLQEMQMTSLSRARILTAALLVSLSMAAVGIRPADASPPGLKAHPPILIDAPYAFTSTNAVTSGSATDKDRSIIQGRSIEASRANGIQSSN